MFDNWVWASCDAERLNREEAAFRSEEEICGALVIGSRRCNANASTGLSARWRMLPPAFKMPLSSWTEEGIKHAGEKVKRVANAPRHACEAATPRDFIHHPHHKSAVSSNRECDFVGRALPGSAYDSRPGALFNPRKSRECWGSGCCFSLRRGAWLIAPTPSPSPRDVQSDKPAVAWALSRHQSLAQIRRNMYPPPP